MAFVLFCILIVFTVLTRCIKSLPVPEHISKMTDVVEKELGIDKIEHFKDLMMNLNAMRKENRHCDLTINVEGKKLYAHKAVLCASSDYFNAMFSHDTLEEQQGVVTMKEVDYTAVEKCVDFFYTGKIVLSVDQCGSALLCASIMQLGKVCEAIGNFLQGSIQVENIFQIKEIASKFSIKILERECEEFAITNIIAISKLHEFTMIDVNFLTRLMKMNASSIAEDVKLACAIQWINSDLDNRIEHLDTLLDILKPMNLTPGYCKFLMEKEPLCKTSMCLVRFLFFSFAREEMASFDPLNAPQPSNVYAIGVPEQNITYYDDYVDEFLNL